MNRPAPEPEETTDLVRRPCCPSCNHPIEDRRNFCPACGAALPSLRSVVLDKTSLKAIRHG